MGKTIDVRLTIDDEGQLHTVEPLGEGGKVFKQDNPEDKMMAEKYGIRYGNTEKGDHPTVKGLDLAEAEIRGVAVVAISYRNPGCTYWRIRRTPNGYDWICVG